MVRRWWPLPVAIAGSIVVQKVVYTSRFDVSGHAAEHVGSGSFIFFATVVAGVLLWTTPAARRSPVVLIGLAGWLAAGIAIAIGNVRVIDALIEGGQATTTTAALVDTPGLHNAHWLANTAPLYALASAFVVILGLHLVRAGSVSLFASAAVLNLVVPYWLVPGFGVIVVTIARVIAREKAARANASSEAESPAVPAL